MSAEPIDFAAEGLLDGLEGEARRERLALLQALADEGVTLAELRRTTAAGTVIFLPADRVIVGDQRYTADEVSRAERRRARVSRRRAARDGPADTRARASRSTPRHELESARRIVFARAGRHLRRGVARAAACAQPRSLPDRRPPARPPSETRPGARHQRARPRRSLRAGGGAAVPDCVDPMVSNVLALHLRHAAQSEVISAMERDGGKLPGSREVAVCFADLVGFTRLGEEVPPDELGRLAARLEALASDVAVPPVRLVKTIGDAAMLASHRARAAARRGARADRRRRSRGRGLPSAARRRGARPGAAARRRLVRPAGQPGQPHHLDRPPRQPAGRARAARSRANGPYRWSYAGERRIRGIRGAVPLFRARRELVES